MSDVSSLQDLCVVMAGVDVWMRDDVMNIIYTSGKPIKYRKYEAAWGKIEEKVEEKVNKLELALGLKEAILRLIKPIGWQMMAWYKHCRYEHRFSPRKAREIVWTARGTIERQKTAQIMLKNEELDVETRYKLSCIYCLETEIRILWEKIAEDRKSEFYNEEDAGAVKQHDLVVLWTYLILNQQFKMKKLIEKKWLRSKDSVFPLSLLLGPNLYLYAFQCGVLDGNSAAAKHFLSRLNRKEQDLMLMAYAERAATNRISAQEKYYSPVPEQFHSETFHFLVEQMSPQQVTQLLKERAHHILSPFLDWPYQHLFMGHFRSNRRSIPKYAHSALLVSIIQEISIKRADFDYKELLRSFWNESPKAHKRYDIRFMDHQALAILFKAEEEELIKMLLDNKFTEEKEILIFDEKALDICCDLVLKDKWDLLEWVLQRCLPSGPSMVMFKDAFMERNASKMDNTSKFIIFLDQLIEKKNYF